MKIWMLSQHYQCPHAKATRPVCWAYSNGHHAPIHPEDVENGWSLVLCDSNAHQIEAAEQDRRVQVYRTLHDPVTPQTVTAYADKGAQAGMMLYELLRLLAKSEARYMTES